MIAGYFGFFSQRTSAMSFDVKTAIREHLGRQHPAMVALLASLFASD
jgi:hypothetical protein